MTKYELLELSNQLTKAIDDCTDWFVLSRWERNPVKKAAYEAIYEEKNKEYLRILEETHGKLTK